MEGTKIYVAKGSLEVESYKNMRVNGIARKLDPFLFALMKAFLILYNGNSSWWKVKRMCIAYQGEHLQWEHLLTFLHGKCPSNNKVICWISLPLLSLRLSLPHETEKQTTRPQNYDCSV